MMPASASGQAKLAGVGWLALSSVLASACSDPYEPDLQVWPTDGPGAITGGALPQDTSGGATAGFPAVSGSGGTTGGTPGVNGSPQTTGGASAGGGGVSGGAGSLGGSTSGGSQSAGGSAASVNCSLSVKVTTATAGGRYAPRNIGAIWVADESGNFLRSLEVWAQKRVKHLSAWNSATSQAGTPGNRVDIVSQATLSSHRAHTAVWNCQDFKKLPVPDGTYRVYFEMTDNSATGPNRFETFTKGPAAVTLSPPDNNNFKAMELSFQP